MKQIYTLTLLLFIQHLTYCQQGNSLNFDGDDDYIKIEKNTSLNFTNDDFTIEAIINRSISNTDDNIIGKDNFLDETGYSFWVLADNKIILRFGQTFYSSNSTIPNSINTHVAATYDTSEDEIRLYINGTLDATHLSVIVPVNNTEALYIGTPQDAAGNPAFAFSGSIDEIRIWNVAKSGVDISNNMSNELTLPQTGLISYYKFNQGTANGNNSNETTLNDELNLNNGSLVGFALSGTSSNWVAQSTLSLKALVSKPSFKIYPNPSNKFIQLSGLTKTDNYSIYNSIGIEITRGVIKNKEEINIRNYPNGLYFLKFEKGNTLKFIKE
jgi:hypothetical protein